MRTNQHTRQRLHFGLPVSIGSVRQLAPVVRHTGFTAAVWAREVTKMRQQYGAPIDDATAKSITAYLQQQYSSGGQK